MSVSFVLSLAALAGAPAIDPVTSGRTTSPAVLQEEAPVEEAIAACGGDAAKLWELAQTLKTASKYADARKVMEKIVEIDPEHADARKGLGHQKYGDQWFKSSVELMMFRRNEEKAMREKGLVRHRDAWVPIADAPFVRMGWTKDDSGTWQDPRKVALLEQEAKFRAEGCEQQDLTWIAPAEFAKWEEGLWKCGEEWLPLEAADQYHAQIFRWWTVPTEHFIVASTCTRAGTDWTAIWVDAVYDSLLRVFGKEPADKPLVIVLNSLEQFNLFAAGDQNQGIPPAEASGFSSLHHAYFAESFFDPSTQPPTYRGCGTAFWDYKPELSGWGKFAVCHAAGLSFAEAIDPSWETISQVVDNPAGGFQGATFWAEKKIPLWLRFGGATFAEVYAEDKLAEEGGDPWGNRTWAFGHLRQLGGLRSLPEVFAFGRDLNDIPGSTRLIYEAGAIVSFILDGGNKDVSAAHESWKKAFAAGKAGAEELAALQAALVANEKALREFTGQPAPAPSEPATAVSAGAAAGG